ncbi:MAG: glutaredoxin family protein [Chloroflexi bacterium]|nr:glutaredoxin family protein [Chloroflexota bacterium]MCH8799410.1 glutaredoxin family protein [Chloroflexota bacterium]MCH8892763.1 glutaredoxin family protein [Chloroflexota bacterium]MCH9017406.1 glutaredoxin family protein [Chloroflexota bacterium]MCI0789771.1 glutaredoxin family protein [Chloroflexota bacterium]
MTKEYLSQRNVPFVEKDVLNDKSAMNELLKIGVLTTPVTVIDGEVVVGFDRARFEELLGEQG